MDLFPEINRLVTLLTEDVALRSATAYRDPTFTIKLTRQRRHDPRSKTETLLLTYGVPNFAERKFIKGALAADARFPVKTVKLRYWPTTKVTRRKRSRA